LDDHVAVRIIQGRKHVAAVGSARRVGLTDLLRDSIEKVIGLAWADGAVEELSWVHRDSKHTAIGGIVILQQEEYKLGSLVDPGGDTQRVEHVVDVEEIVETCSRQNPWLDGWLSSGNSGLVFRM
jgi:hypothetical protein